MMKKILITGGAGYIGSHLADALLIQGSRVFVIDNLSTGKLENIQHNLSNKNFDFFHNTILNEKLIEKLIKRVDIVFHLAAAVGVKNIVDAPLDGMLTNVTGTEIVLRLAFQYKKKVLLASTSEIYGKSKNMPFEEDGDRVLGSTAVHRWSYSTSKALDEHLALAYYDKGLRVVIVRYFNSYGPRIDEKGYGSVIAQFVRQALKGKAITVHGDGKQSRCFTFVEDTVKGTILASQVKKAEGKVFNIGNNKERRIIDLAKHIKKITNSNSKIIFIPYKQCYGQGFEDTRRRIPSIIKAKRMLNFEAGIDLTEGLIRTLSWCKENYL